LCIGKYLQILFFLLSGGLFSQADSTLPKKSGGEVLHRVTSSPEPYDRKEEIIYDNKRYRKHNSYVTLGAGYLSSSIRKDISKTVGVDFQFHIREQHFQIGGNISGHNFGDNNNTQVHLGYGKRWEKNQTNYAIFGGLCAFTGVVGIADPDSADLTVPFYYDGLGLYISAQAVTKFSYDMGLGLEGFAEVSPYQSLVGLKVILFFSGSYRGPKKNYNPHVRAENRK
jgi:hypothetical protein